MIGFEKSPLSAGLQDRAAPEPRRRPEFDREPDVASIFLTRLETGPDQRPPGIIGRWVEVDRRAAALALALALAGSGVAAQEAAEPAPQPPGPAPPAVTFAGGASAITEIHRNWTVNCNVQGTNKGCLFSQSLSNTANGQRLFTIEVRVAAEDRIEGGMLLPFGLNLNAGVSLALDDQPFGEKIAFTTCTQQGCFAPFSADGAALAALQSGSTLKVGALNGATGEPVIFGVSLAGFTSAMNRAVALPQ